VMGRFDHPTLKPSTMARRYVASGRAHTLVTKSSWPPSVKEEARTLIAQQFAAKGADAKVNELVATARALEKSGNLKVRAKPTLIQVAPSVSTATSATLTDLDMRELAIIDRMRARLMPSVPTSIKHLNGASTRA
jgi:hypothetical protein